MHLFSLLEKLQETGLEPEDYEPGYILGTDEADFSVHNYEDRSAQEIIAADRLFLGHFEFTPRVLRESHGPDSEEVLGHFEERMIGLTEEKAV